MSAAQESLLGGARRLPIMIIKFMPEAAAQVAKRATSAALLRRSAKSPDF
jgi:hypothetical protein